MNAPWMVTAYAEYGQAELSGRRNNNSRIVEYLKTVGNFSRDETPWCSAFVNWVITHANMAGTGRANARSWLKWGYRMPSPEYGCITVFRRGNSSWQGHVAFYLEETSTHIKVLGGNQSNQVCEKLYPKRTLLAYRWPFPVGQIIRRDERGRIVDRELIEGLIITAGGS